LASLGANAHALGDHLERALTIPGSNSTFDCGERCFWQQHSENSVKYRFDGCKRSKETVRRCNREHRALAVALVEPDKSDANSTPQNTHKTRTRHARDTRQRRATKGRRGSENGPRLTLVNCVCNESTIFLMTFSNSFFILVRKVGIDWRTH
jgi:hypothetical protein